MSFYVISELTRTAARLAMILFAIAFIYDGLRNGKQLTRRLWQSFAAIQIIYFIFLIAYHLVISELPQFDALNGLLSIGTLMFCVILWHIRRQDVQMGRVFAPSITAYGLAFLLAALPISRILPPETDAPIYHVMLYGMIAVIIIRLLLDIKAGLRRWAASK